jgi:hypothetical protein
VDVGRMEHLFRMHKEAKAEGARTAFLAAFARLQAELPAVERKGTGHNQKRYARFEDFIETIKKPLADHGFSLSFRINQLGVADGNGAIQQSGIRITGVLGHEDGHQEETSLVLPADTSGSKNAVQALGSTISYGKRYVGMTLLGIATEDEDDDGKKAAGAGETISAEQLDQLQTAVDDTSADVAKFCRYFKIDAIGALPAARFTQAMTLLEGKKRART